MDGESTGTLRVVATPIGNLGDASPRCREALGSADLIACEDTRVAAKLLAALALESPPLISYRDANETASAEGLVEKLRQGQTVAVLPDAGTPGISDPGFRLVRLCHREGIPVVPVPGPSACVAALSASGLPSDRFYFVGFLPPKSAARRRFLAAHADFPSTIILYESVHRIEKLLDEIVGELGPGRVLSVARELTKKFETILSGPAESVRAAVLDRSRKGEFTVLLAPQDFRL
jgi:16S rRNA (cytidine1402-2'-O)-methyltransferase